MTKANVFALLLGFVLTLGLGCVADVPDEIDETSIETAAAVCLSKPNVPCCDDGDPCTRDWRDQNGDCQAEPIVDCEPPIIGRH